MWRKLLLTGLVLSLALTSVFAADVNQMSTLENTLVKYDAGQPISSSEKNLIADELTKRESYVKTQQIAESRENYTNTSDLRSALTEGFEGVFPPPGWSNTAIVDTYVWSQSSTEAYSGTYAASFKNSSYSARTAELQTPRLDLTASSTDALTFYLKDNAWGSDQDELWVQLSTDGGANWDTLAYFGTDIATFTLQTFDLETDVAQTDDAYIKFTATTHYGYGVYIDDVTGPEIYVAPEPPVAVTNPLPADAATDVVLSQVLSWGASFGATGYDLSFGTDNPPTNVLDAADQGDVLTYAPTLAYGTTYYWSVTPYNAYGDGTGTVVWSFTTMDDPTLTPPFTETFDTFETSYPYAPPLNWTKLAGLMDEDISLAEPSYPDKWRGEAYANNSSNPVSARMNVYYYNRMDWLISPPIDLGDGSISYQAEFDIIAQEYNSETLDAVWDVDDRFDFIISTDGGATWDQANILLSHNSTTGLGATAVHEIVDLSAYTGIVKLAFYGETQVSGGDWELFVKDFTVQEPPIIPIVALSTTEIDFGQNPVGSSVSYDVTITNNGGADLVISALDGAPPFSSTYSGTIIPGASDVATISYDPTEAVTSTMDMVLVISGTYEGDDAIALSGSAYPASYVTEGFEEGELPYGWQILEVIGNPWEILSSSSYAHTGDYCVKGPYTYSGGGESWLILPQLDLTSGDFLEFWLDGYSSAGGLDVEIYISETGSSPADFTTLLASYIGGDNQPSSYELISIDLSAYTNTYAYVALKLVDDNGYSVYLDDFLMPPLAPSTDTPFFSEYLEGSGNNKGLEIYNGTGATIDLDEYQIAQSSGGGGWDLYHAFPADATLDHGEVWLMVTDQSFAEMQAIADEVLPYDVNDQVVHFNGDDARGLIHIVGTDTTLLDVFGTPDVDPPGGAWDVAGVFEGAREYTLMRKPAVSTGNLDWAASAGTNADDSEWIVHDQDFWYGMGYHNEDYPLPGDACDLPIVYGDVNDPAMVGATEPSGVAWYTFYNDGSYDNVFASLCGSDFDTRIEVWADCDSTTYLAYNDDFCGLDSEVDLGELPAGDYLVKIFGWGSGSGDYLLTITGTNGVPDFEVTSMDYYGQDTLDVVVTNIGDGDSPGYAGTDYHGLYINGDYLGYVAVEDVALLAGESFTYSLIGINYDFLGVGIHRIDFEADVDDDVLEIDETNNADSLMIEIVYPPLAPRHVMAMGGEAQVALTWSTAVIPPPDPEALWAGLGGVSELKTKPAITFAPEILAKRDAARGSGFRDAGDTCAEAVELTVADGSVVSAPYAPYWYSYTPAADGFLTASSDGLTTEDTKVYAYDACDAAYIDYDDDGGAGLQSILTIPVTGGTTYYFEWVDAWSAAAFDWSLTYIDYLPMADLEVTEMYVEDDAVFAVITNIGDLDAAGVSCHWWVDGVDVAYEYTDLLIPTAADTLGLYGFSWANLGAGTFNVAIEVDFWGSLAETSEENNLDSISVVIEDPDYMPTYNVYRDDALLAGGLDAVNRYFDGEYIDDAVTVDVEYTYYITQIMEDLSESIPSASVSATPWAPVVWSFPHTEDFEDITDNLIPFGYVNEELGIPDGGNWEIGDSAYVYTTYGNTHFPDHTQFAFLDDDGIGSGVNGNEILWTPWVDLTTSTNPQVQFNYFIRGTIGESAEFIVFAGDSVSAVYPLPPDPSGWSGALFNIGDYSGETIRFGFHYNDGGNWAWGMAVDDIVIEETPLPGTIAGTVADGDGNGIGYANVHVMGLFVDEGTMTDAAGAYSITVPAGDYDVEVMRVNYHPAMAQTSVTEGGSITLDFVLDMYLPAPDMLMAFPSMEDTTIGLMWAPPLPMGMVAYDDGSFETSYWVSNPSTTNDYFAAHFKAAITPGYVINEIAILASGDDAETAFENVWVVGSDDTLGLPDFSDVLWTSVGNNVAVSPEMAWDFYPVGASPATQDFWVVMQYPAGSTGPYIATDTDTFIGNCIGASTVDGDGNPEWGSFPYTLGIRAFLGEPITGRSVVLHGSETISVEKLGQPLALSVKQDVTSYGSVEAPAFTTVGRELLSYNVYRSLDPMVFGDAYGTAAGEIFFDDDFDFDTEYFYTVSAVYDLGESDYSNVDAFTYWSPLYLNHYEDFMYPDLTPLEDIGWVTDDGAGNVAPNFGVEDEMLHFDWSPTAVDFYQTVTSPVADFTGATAARISFYLYLDDYSDLDNGTLDISASISNDDFVNETELFAHNDSVYGDIDDFMIFDISAVAAGTDGWQLRFTVEGATSFTLDHLWIDDVMVESDVYMGPGEFDLLSPASDSDVEITSANVATGSLLFAWESAGDDMMYGVELTGSLGSVIIPFDTSATEVLIPYTVLSAAFDFAGVTAVDGTWDIIAYNGMDMDYSANGPFNLTIGSTVGTDDAFVPDVFALYQNYPNPFNPVTTITYDIPEASDVRLVVYNLVGQPVRVLVNGFQNPSRYTLAWNGLSDNGLPVSSGIYIYRLESESFVKTMKMMYLK